jgi:5-methylcytosine-specific restriction enzyme A
VPSRIKTYRDARIPPASGCYERARPRQADKNFYSAKRWLDFRSRFLARHPLCAGCKELGVTTLARHVHHVKPRKEFPALAFDEANCEGLCIPCHNARERR